MVVEALRVLVDWRVLVEAVRVLLESFTVLI